MFYRDQNGQSYKIFVDFRLPQQLNGLQKLVPVPWGCVWLEKLLDKGITGIYTSPQWSFPCVFSFFPNFLTFSLKTSTFSPRRTAGTLTHHFSQFPECSRLLLPQFWDRYVGLTEQSCPNQEKYEKKHENLLFL